MADGVNDLHGMNTEDLCEWLGEQPEIKNKVGKLKKACAVIGY